MNRKMPESVKRELHLRKSMKRAIKGTSKALRTHTIGMCPIKIEPKACFSNATIAAPVKGKPHICKREGWWRVSAMPKPYHKYALTFGKAHDFACNANEAGRQQLFQRMLGDEHSH